MSATNIEWCTHVWNPVTGCEKIAQGCKHCYAETLAKRFWGARAFSDVQTHPDRLDAPMRWRKPARVFVNSMSDLFHTAVPFEFIAAVYGVMAASPQHQFCILTKRSQRMREFMEWRWRPADAGRTGRTPEGHPTRMIGGVHGWNNGDGTRSMADCVSHAYEIGGDGVRDKLTDAIPIRVSFPLPNVIHGYSAATQEDLDAGIADLLATPSALRCLSLEPLVEPVDLTRLVRPYDGDRPLWPCSEPLLTGLDWVIVGGESGPGARPCDVAWLRAIVAQCKAASVPCFVKQVGSNPTPIRPMRLPAYSATTGKPLRGWYGDGHETIQDRKGADPAEWPEDLRVRQFPEVKQ